MARIPKKKSRSIAVDGIRYRWLVKHTKGRYIGTSAHTASVIVQIDTEKPGPPLTALLVSKLWTRDHEEDTAFDHVAAITPKDVRDIIDHGLKTGWNPLSDCLVAHVLTGELDLQQHRLA